MIGQTVSHYKILEKLGEGGMGVVYKAEDIHLRRVVALKFLSPELTLDEDARTRFKHEAQAASALQHNNICTIHEIDRTPDGRMFICMDYYTGDTLRSRIGHGPLPVTEAVDIAMQIGNGLARAHTADTVHRDIKPANISITEDGVVKILDFGLAMLSDRTRVTKMDTTVGTVAYMSPENTKGETVGPAADVWSLGVILYEMLTGRLPFQANHDAAMMYKILNEPHDPVISGRPDIPDELAKIVDRTLTKDPGGRYEDAGEMVRDLRELAAKLASKKQETASSNRPAVRRSRYWIPVAVIAVIAIAILILRPLLFEGDVVSAPRPVAVISFENKTGDPEYDYLCDVIPNLLITSLEQSKYLSVVTWERMHDLLAQAGRADVGIIDREAGFEACRIDGIDTIVLGSFTKAGNVFVTDVKILDVISKELLKSASARGNGAGSILVSQIDELGREISRGVGLSERKIAAAGAFPIANVTTKSLDAYDYFVRGRDAAHKRYQMDAYRDLKKAVELDSTFAVAWLYLGGAHAYRREIRLKIESYEKAKYYAETAPEKDRLYIEAMYASEISNDADLANRLLTELTTKYPKEKRAWYILGVNHHFAHRFEQAVDAYSKVISLDPLYDDALNGLAYVYATQGDYEQAIVYFEKNAAVNPGNANPHDSMGEMYFKLGRLDEAVMAYERALAIKPGFGSESGIAYIQVLQEDWDGAMDQIEDLIDAVRSEGLKASSRLILAFYHKKSFRWRRSLELSRESAVVFESVGHQFGLSGAKWAEASTYYSMGETRLSRECLDEAKVAMQATGEFPLWARYYSCVLKGLLELKENRVDAAKKRFATIDSLLSELAEKEPQFKEMGAWAAAVYRVEVLLTDGRIDEAISAAGALPPVTIPDLNPLKTYFYNFPYNRDVLARAYVQKGELDDAIAEYERLVTFDPDGSDRRIINPLFHYRLGVLYEGRGDTDRAIRQYGKFLKICGEADPGLEEIADTRRRLAALDR